jgi:hypothetical protein
LPLQNTQYIEVVCPLDHPAADKTPFGQLVTKKSEAGGGWLSWVVAVSDLIPLEVKLERKAVEGHRKKPDGFDLYWKQIGVLETLEEASNPFFIQWNSESHPSTERESKVTLTAIEIYGHPESLINRYDLNGFFTQSSIDFKWIEGEREIGIEAVTFSTQNGMIRID